MCMEMFFEEEKMTEPVRLNKKKEPKPFQFLLIATNHFYDRILRAMFVTLLLVFDFVLFVYSINGRMMENGVVNEAMLYIAGGIFAVFLVLMILLSFSGVAQDALCALVTLLVTLLYFDQFALFDTSNFIELWLEEHASFLTFVGAVPSNWLIGIFFALIIFFAFKYTFVIFLTLLLVAGSFGICLYQTEMAVADKNEYGRVKELAVMKEDARSNNVIYLMAPKLPSYHFLSTIKDVNFRDLRDMIIGFYAVNDFEVYPNAFVQKNDTVSNIVDIYNLVDYGSTASGIRGYAEILNDWDFAHGSLDTMALEDNKLYAALGKEGYKTSTYPMPLFNFCYKDGKLVSDRCVVKQTRPISLYDKKSSLEKNIFALLGEWVISFRNKELKPVAKMLMDMSYMKGMRVISDNRRLSIEGAPAVFDEVYKDFAKDKNGVVYMAFAELPSDLYIFDEFCNLKPRKDWVSLKDNLLYSGGIDLKRKAYADQTKCFLGMAQMFMEKMYQNDKLQNTDIIVQGVSVLRELAGMPAGQYGTFVADKLVNLGIRKAKAPAFVVNTEICLASDVTRSYLLGEQHCYTIDNMKMSTEEALNLKQNLVNNSVIRGSKITNIAADYRDWYEEFRKKSPYYQKWREQVKEESKPLPEVKTPNPVKEVPQAQTEEPLPEPVSEPAQPQVAESQPETAGAEPQADTAEPTETVAEQPAETVGQQAENVEQPQEVLAEKPQEQAVPQDVTEPAQEAAQPVESQPEAVSEPAETTETPQAENVESVIAETAAESTEGAATEPAEEQSAAPIVEENAKLAADAEEAAPVENAAEAASDTPQSETAAPVEVNPEQNIEGNAVAEETTASAEENPVN